MYLENTSRQFDRTHSDGTLAYVDRCTAFEDGSADGDWCALVVDRNQHMKLYRDPDLTRGITVDAPLDVTPQAPRPRVRQPIMLTQAGDANLPAPFHRQLPIAAVVGTSSSPSGPAPTRGKDTSPAEGGSKEPTNRPVSRP